MNISIFTATMTALIANLISSSAVYAIDDDRKIYPGSMCVRFSGATNQNVNLNFSAIGNPSTTQRLRVDCPVVHDEIGDGTNSGWFRAIDQNFGAGANNDVRCSINSIFRSGSSWFGWSTPSRNTPSDGDQVQQVNFGTDLGSNSRSHYFFGCSIPPRQGGRTSFIISYSVEED